MFWTAVEVDGLWGWPTSGVGIGSGDESGFGRAEPLWGLEAGGLGGLGGGVFPGLWLLREHGRAVFALDVGARTMGRESGSWGPRGRSAGLKIALRAKGNNSALRAVGERGRRPCVSRLAWKQGHLA
jgi:hypothetical protein